MKAEIITDPDALRAIEPAWWALWSRQKKATPFTSPAWLIPWWRAFAPGSLASVAVWHDGNLAGLAPLYLEHGAAGSRLLPLGIGLSDQSDILIDPAWASEAARELTAALEEGITSWDLWSAEEAPPGAAVLEMARPAQWSEDRDAQSVCPVVTLPSGAHVLDAVVPPRMLRKWRMAGHRTARRAHNVELAEARSVERMLHDLFRLHEKRWRTRGEGGVLLDARVRRFHQAATRRLLEAGMLRLRALWIDDRVAGIYYGLQDARQAYAYIGGFDPDFGFESPGTVLIGAALEDALSSGCEAFDFLRGEETYKFGWGATPQCNTRRTFRRAGR